MRPVQAGNRGRIVLFERDQRAVCDFRVTAVGRRGVAPNPRIHTDDHRAPEITDRKRRFELLALQAVGAFCRRKVAAVMLQTCGVINANVRRDLGVVQSVRRYVNQRTDSPPILIRRVRKEHVCTGRNLYARDFRTQR
jgi:hypothetical protein